MADLEFTQGEDLSFGLTLTDAADAPIPITGDSFDAKIKDISDLEESLAEFSFEITDGANGKVTFSLTDTQTLEVPSTVEYNAKGVESATPARLLFYDVFRTDHASGRRKKLTNGLVKVYPCISFEGV